MFWNYYYENTVGGEHVGISELPHHWSRIARGRLHLPLMFQSQLERGFCATSTTQWDSQLRIQDTNTEKTASVAMQPKRSRCIWLVSSNSICSFPHLRRSSSLMRAFARRRTQLIGYRLLLLYRCRQLFARKCICARTSFRGDTRFAHKTEMCIVWVYTSYSYRE